MESDSESHTECRCLSRRRRLNPCFNGTGFRALKMSNSSLLRTGLNPCFNGTGFRVAKTYAIVFAIFVLILVLMELDSEQVCLPKNGKFILGLNPCFNGTGFRGLLETLSQKETMSLNPCFNGTGFRALYLQFS